MTGARRRPVLVIHGGTGARPDRARAAAIRRSLLRAAAAACAQLKRGSALEAVVSAVRLIEDDPLFNAGTGSVLQADGRARMSASVMDGARGAFGAVLNIERVRHPIDVAARLLEEPGHRVLEGAGAVRYARAHGLRPWNPVTAQRRSNWRRRLNETGAMGTIGAVALDRAGQLAAATSTGGAELAPVGRVSDSGMPVGNFATSTVAISCTGYGQDVIEHGLAVRIAQQMEDGRSLAEAFRLAFTALRRRGGRVGAIAVDRAGRIAWQTTLPALFAVAKIGGKYQIIGDSH